MVTLSYYPGCSMKTSSKLYEASMKKVFSRYGVGLKEVEDWSCCGASAASTIDETTAYALPARNIAVAEKEGFNLFAPCSACYNRSKIANEILRQDDRLQKEINEIISPLEWTGSIEVKNIIEVVDEYVGTEQIARSRIYDLSTLKIAPYYGCVLTRMTRVEPFDDKENPESMDGLLTAAGVSLVQWPYKMECCGASKTLTDRPLTAKLSGKIMDKAVAVGADCIVTPCPLCQMNLDLLPYIGGNAKNLPVLFLSEILELALFGTMSEAASHIIPVNSLSEKVRKI